MLSHSPVVDYREGVDILAKKIRAYEQNAPYIATIRGISGVGKSHFGRGIVEKLWFSKKGTFTKPHNLERELEQKTALEYALLEIDHIDSDYETLIERKTKQLWGIVPDCRVLIVYDLARLLSSDLSLERIFTFFDLVVENKEHPNYK